jgi:Mg-chelatase subunit ChlI
VVTSSSKTKVTTREVASTYGVGAGALIAASLEAAHSGSSMSTAVESEEVASEVELASPRSRSPRKPLPPLPSPRSQAPSPPSQEQHVSSRQNDVVTIAHDSGKGKEKEFLKDRTSPRSVIVITLSSRTCSPYLTTSPFEMHALTVL